MSLSAQTRITDELTGYLGAIAATQYSLQPCPGVVAQESLSNIWMKLLIL